jgi:hypothetical protein
VCFFLVFLERELVGESRGRRESRREGLGIKNLYIVLKRSAVDRPSTGFCIDWLLGFKYAVCQDFLTKIWALQACLVKKTKTQRDSL